MVSGNHFGVLDTDAIKQGLKSTEAFHGMQNTPADSIMLSLFQGTPNGTNRDTISPLLILTGSPPDWRGKGRISEQSC